MVKISVGVAPGPQTETLAALAEELGYDRVWLYDSPAIYEDVWIALSRAADVTERIGLGTAVLVPHSRHPMVTASAIATMERIAPGRCTYAFGTGASARWCLDQPALTWKFMRTYLEQLKGLLAGDVVEIDGKSCQMMHHHELAKARPIDVPIVLSAFGPKGIGVAESINADGVMNLFTPAAGFAERIQMVSGTVLDPGESVTHARPAAAIGPWYVITYHAFHQAAGEAVDDMPGGAEWRAEIEATRPEGQRHLAVWEGHATHLVERDGPVMAASGDGIIGMSWVGDAADIRARVDAVEAEGVTDVMYTPAGPDPAREMRAFAAAVRN
jgi:5,10-methylenetetrahydromethanopterin reductase